MSGLDNFRSQYPQYNDMSDADLADRIHAKYYNDIPYDTFAKKMGVTQQTPQPQKQSLLSSMANSAPTNFVNSAGAGVARGLLDLPKDAINLGAEGIQKLRGLPTHPVVSNSFITQGAADPRVASAAEPAGQLASPIPEIKAGSALLKGAKGLLARVGEHAANTAATNTALGAVQASKDPNHFVRDTVLSGLAGTALHGATAAGLNAVPLLKTGIAKLAKSTALDSKEDIAARIKNIGDTPAPIGDVVNSPVLKGTYNDYAKAIPGSGIAKKQTQVVKDASDHVNNLLDNLKGGLNEEEITPAIKNELTKNQEIHSAARDKFYETAKESAGDMSMAGWPKVKAYATNILKEYGSQPKSVPATLDKEPGVMSDLQGLASGDFNTPKIPEKQPEQTPQSPIILPPHLIEPPKIIPKKKAVTTLQTAINAATSLGNSAREAKIAGKKPVAAIYKGAKTKLDKTIEDKLLSSGKQDALKAYKEGKLYHGKYVAPYDSDSMIKAMYTPDKDNSLDKVLLQPKSKQVVKDLSPENKKRLLYLHLSPAINEAESGNDSALSSRLFNRYDKLSSTQKDQLLTKSEQKQFQKLKSMGALSTEASKELKKSSLPQYVAGAGALIAGHMVPSLHPMISGPSIIGGARKFSNFMTSPELRQMVLGQSAKFKTPNKLIGKTGSLLAPYWIKDMDNQGQ